MRAILPSMKERKRYIAFEVISKNEVSGESVDSALGRSLSGFFGEFGKSGIAMKMLMDKWNKNFQRGILRVNRKYANHAKALFCATNKIGRSSVIIRSLGVSGTIKKAERKYLI